MAEPSLELLRLEADDVRPDFTTGDEDLDEFFHIDSIEACKELLCVTYTLIESDIAIAFFSVSNDSIKREDVPKSAIRKLLKVIPFTKRYSSMPAAKIGRLGVAEKNQRSGYGTKVLDYLKMSCTTDNKSGCRFLIVDSYNTEEATNFYQKNGFRYLTGDDASDKTRIMYFDLITFIRAAP